MDLDDWGSLLRCLLDKSHELNAKFSNASCCNLRSSVGEGDTGSVCTLTDFRVQYAAKVIENVVKILDSPREVFVCTEGCTGTSVAPQGAFVVVVGPVTNPNTGKKDVVTPPQEYFELRQACLKCCERGIDKATEAALTTAVISYELLRINVSKPVVATGLRSSADDSVPTEAVRVLYNRSRIVNILNKFEERVNASQYPCLPPLPATNFQMLKHNEERSLIKKVEQFFATVHCWQLAKIGQVPAKLWTFLLTLSQDYSAYYNRVRTLCEVGSDSYETMHARIWMLKTVLAVYDSALRILNIEQLNQL